MQQALERIARTLESYCEGNLSRALAVIELVSAFKVVSKHIIDPAILHTSVTAYIEAALSKIDVGELNQGQATVVLSKVYKAANENDPDLLEMISVQP